MNIGNTGEHLAIQWQEFRNDSGEEIPAFGCVRITGMTTRGDRNLLTVSKPNTYGAQYSHRINGPLPVGIGAYGICCIGPQVAALYDTADGSPIFGDRWGPRDATWKLKKNTGGFQILGNLDTSNGICIVSPCPMLEFVGKTDAAVTKSSSVTVSIWTGASGAESDSGVNMTSVYSRYADVGTGKWVRCAINLQGTMATAWELIDAECT
jgi:hypothetical protein